MTILQTMECSMTFPGNRRAKVYVEESKTNYYVAFRPIGWACWFSPIKVKKDKFICNMLAAVDVAYNEYMKDDIWRWK